LCPLLILDLAPIIIYNLYVLLDEFDWVFKKSGGN